LSEPGAPDALESGSRGPVSRDGRRWLAPIAGALAAFSFFTRLPVGKTSYQIEDWHWAPAHLPLVGVIVGAWSALVFRASLALGLGATLTGTLAVASSVWLTGALHEDGFADSADGLGGAHGGKRALEIMKDSRIGTYGAIALGVSMLGRTGAVGELGPASGFELVLVHCLARIGPVWLMATLPHIGEAAASKSKSLFLTRKVHVLTAVGWGALCMVVGTALGVLSPSSALAVAAALILTTVLCARRFKQAVGGITGDLLGAAEQVGELSAWITLLATRSL
jgi:adenosylcobinamide-GDP ribazoletransferase